MVEADYVVPHSKKKDSKKRPRHWKTSSDPVQRTRTSREKACEAYFHYITSPINHWHSPSEIKYYGNCRLEAANSHGWPIRPPANDETFILRAGCALHMGRDKFFRIDRKKRESNFSALAAVGISH